jgi:mitochondrial intermediate peptidase
MSFLQSLAELHKPIAQADVDQLAAVKKIFKGSPTPPQIQAWDRFFYAQFISPPYNPSPPPSPQPTTSSDDPSPAQSQPIPHVQDPFHTSRTPASASLTYDPLSPYFTVGQTFAGLSNLLQALYGVQFVLAPTRPGETWHADVRKLNVVHETEGHIGVVYCDVFRRESASVRKYDSAAQFTVRCSRRIDEDHILAPPDDKSFTGGEVDGMRCVENVKDVVVDGVKKVYQLPIVVLVTSFSRVESDGVPSCLSLSEVETLFHEMGHVMHCKDVFLLQSFRTNFTLTFIF